LRKETWFMGKGKTRGPERKLGDLPQPKETPDPGNLGGNLFKKKYLERVKTRSNELV